MTTNPSAAPGSGDPSVTPATDSAAASEESTLVQRLAAEAVGTFVFLFLGAGAVAFTAASLGSADLGDFGGLGANALAFAFALSVTGYAFSRISGGHFNPAVSVASALAGRTGWKDAGLYVAAQVGGAILAGLVLLVLILGFDGSDGQDSLWQTGFGEAFNDYAWWAAFLLEVLLTVVFVYLVLAVTDRRHEHRGSAPLAIGLGYGAVVFAGAAATGGSANPARSIGTNLFAGVDPLLSLWVFVLAPLVGAVVAGATYPLLFGRDRGAIAGSGLTFGRGGGSRRSRKQQQQQQYAGYQQQGYYGDQPQGYYGDQQQDQWGQQQPYYGDQQQGGWQGQPDQQSGWEQQPYYGDQQQDQWGRQQGYHGDQQQGGWQGQPDQQQDQAGWQGQPGQGQPEQDPDPNRGDGHTRMRPDQG